MTNEFDTNFYTELFMPDANDVYKYTNPNGCPIRATFFVCGKSNEYPVVSIVIHLGKVVYTNIIKL